MADNVSYTPGSGVNIAADDVGGVLFQRVKIATGADGTAVDATASNPIPVAAYGELMETLQAMRIALELLAKNLSWVSFDAGSRARIVSDNSSNLGTVSSVDRLNRAGSALSLDLGMTFKDFSTLTADNLRRNITVT